MERHSPDLFEALSKHFGRGFEENHEYTRPQIRESNPTTQK